MKKITVNVTTARKNLFNLIDMVSKENIEITITKNGLKTPVVLKKEDIKVKNEVIRKNIQLIEQLGGSMKSKYAFKTNKKLNKQVNKVMLNNYKKEYEK